MSNQLEMSLDDIIKANKSTGKGGRGGGRGVGRGGFAGRSGPIRRNFNQQTYRASPYIKPVVPQAAVSWQHDMYDGVAVANGGARAPAETKLYVTNLDYNVSNEDIRELFSECGEVKRASIHYDRSGRSKGTADITFGQRAHALAAVKRYNGVQLDGKPMKIEIVGGIQAVAPVQAVVAPRFLPASFGGGRGGRGVMVGRGRGGFRGRGRGGRGGGRGGRQQPTKTQEELDKELDSYHAETMET